jgi:hypothetical protein
MTQPNDEEEKTKKAREEFRNSHPHFPLDPELYAFEIEQIGLALDVVRKPHHLHWGDAFNLQSSFLIRKRLNDLDIELHAMKEGLASLNKSSKRLESVTVALLLATLLLLGTAMWPYIAHLLFPAAQ